MASTSPLNAIRAAICGVLDSSSDLAEALRGRMAFRDVRAFTTFPFLAIGFTRNEAGPESHIREHTVTVHLWLSPGESEAAQALMDSIREALDRGPLLIEDAQVASFRFERSGVRLASELDALHATVCYRLRLSGMHRPASVEAAECR